MQKKGVRAFLAVVLAGQLAMGLTADAFGAEPSKTRPAAAREKPGARPAPEAKAEGCKPPGPKVKIKVSLKPDTEVADLITWYATLTCTSVLLSSGSPIAGKKVTLLTPNPMTLAQLHDLFLAALDSVGLTVEPDGKVLHIIDAARARHSNSPVDKQKQ